MVNRSNVKAITGASGFVGHRLLETLINQEIQVSVLSHTRQIQVVNQSDTVRVVDGDLSDLETLMNLVKDSDVVYHLAAYVHKPTITSEHRETSIEINFTGSKNLIDACIEQKNPPFFVFFSTTAVYGNLEGEMVENLDCRPDTVYGRSKLAAERYLMDKIKSGLIEGCILRPCSIIGENAPGNLNRVIKIIDKGILPIFDGGLNKKSLICVDDVVSAAILCAEMKQKSNSMIYNLADDHPKQIIEISITFAKALEKKPLIINLPKNLFIFLAELWDLFAGLTKGKLPYLKRTVSTYSSDDIANAEKIGDELGFATKISVEEGLNRMVASYRTKV